MTCRTAREEGGGCSDGVVVLRTNWNMYLVRIKLCLLIFEKSTFSFCSTNLLYNVFVWGDVNLTIDNKIEFFFLGFSSLFYF